MTLGGIGVQRKTRRMREATGLVLGGAAALQGLEVLKDVKSGASLTGHIGAFAGIGIAGAMSNVALNLIDEAYPVKKRVRKKGR